MFQKKTNLMPVPEEVGRFYDRLATQGATTTATTLGNNLHVGYWDDPDSEVSFDEAADRLTEYYDRRN
jgi:O-methyltransferase StaMB